ncbi:hypothetical protein [Mucisphaera calidilacus]|uniref:Uncharacterized protein n=1 Tax=Mucisphaera calidilacus TaxID=2527982 RepID=A0A518BY16_9BACT|nr:hypothetical protein [Mucisphaera calidilacus]QDU71877.1 hypothetical protein Pan265_17350 [Mucisphaera calidilacus]
MTSTLHRDPATTSATATATFEREGLCKLDGLDAYAIPDFDRLPPFLISLLSEGDVWCYISSRFGLTAGRIEPANCLFPYCTDNELHLVHPHTGPITTGHVHRAGQPPRLWSPLRDAPRPASRRRLIKTVLGDRLLAEEIQEDLALRYSMRLAPTATLGLIRTVTIENLSAGDAVRLDLMDGYLGLLPSGFALPILKNGSCLVDAYTQAEVDPETGLAIFAQTAGIVDTPKPSESLYANIAWSTGATAASVTLDHDHLTSFRRGKEPASTRLLQGRRGAYLVHRPIDLAPGQSIVWHVVLDARRTQTQTADAITRLHKPERITELIERSLTSTSKALKANVGSTDAWQVTGSPRAALHHAANVLFNNARGGVPNDGYKAPRHDVLDFISTRNHAAGPGFERLLGDRGSDVDVLEMKRRAHAAGNASLARLADEYLPLTFGRRHGDPSRPWNQFAIRVADDQGNPVLNHQGNWRDIFQNWEAMTLSFPGYLRSIISKFLNATTIDGFNPYRITRDGIDWERPNPDDPWAHIGYWGDHQLIYLVRLLEQLAVHDPHQLAAMARTDCYAFADVPYRLVTYDRIVANPRETIEFDAEHDRAIERRVKSMGTDARLLGDERGGILHAGLIEKLLIPMLSKLSALVPDGGIWMNTQRPEWNDANNALAGYGLSVVTLAYLHRYARFLRKLVETLGDAPITMSQPLDAWLTEVSTSLAGLGGRVAAGLSPTERRAVMDRLGRSFETYHTAINQHGRGDSKTVDHARVIELLDHALDASEQGLRANLREDGLIHSYNTLRLADHSAAVERLPLMLEGQVAALSSGIFTPDECASMLDVLFASDLYREDQQSFILYPRRTMPGFLDKGRIPQEVVDATPLLTKLAQAKANSLVEADATGTLRFASGLENHEALDRAIDRHGSLSTEQRESLHTVYEGIFNHHAYTGRSGSMFAYEGNGSIYWHMVSKLLLAVQEVQIASEDGGSSPETSRRLRAHYDRVRHGIGFNKTASEYGAFPLDPYSHTPHGRGAQQPGMTGQVKEEIITRRAELGIFVDRGRYRFAPEKVRSDEWLDADTSVALDTTNGIIERELSPGSLALTLCQTPVIYTQAEVDEPLIEIHASDQSTRQQPGLTLSADDSRAVQNRDGSIRLIIVKTPPLNT